MRRFGKTTVSLTFVALVLLAIAFKLDLFATNSNIYSEIQRLMEVMQAVQKLYVEDVQPRKLVDGAINGMLEQLDPHSVYIPRERIQEITEQFEGEFEGIGIEFIIHNKIPTVVSPIAGSPSEELGLRPGDQIVKIEGRSTYGITEDQVREQLMGPKGTKVGIQINRVGIEEPFAVTITRDDIPIYSVTAAFMIDDRCGYIRVGRFAKTTNDEFEKALQRLESGGMQRLILDLRGNSGGYLEQAVEMADKFLESGKRIVYTRGRMPNVNEDYYSTRNVIRPSVPLIVLINHGSASASEIVAGAIQDWDRGLIIGETSFGKGLVQNQIFLKDGSAVRVTIARYYTPSGRLIQRSYDDGLVEYVADAYDDLDPNGLPDSTENKPVFTTSAGRKVYGGGGITPDITIKSRRLSMTTVKLIQNQVFFEYGSMYANQHPGLKDDFTAFKNYFRVEQSLVGGVLRLAKVKGLELVSSEIEQDLDFIKKRIKSQIARHLWGSAKYQQIEILEDEQVQEAMQYFSEAAKIAGLTFRR